MTNNNNKKSKYELTVYEERIVNTIEDAYRPLTTKQIAEFSGISYNTTVSNLRILLTKKKVKMTKETNKIYWEVI